MEEVEVVIKDASVEAGALTCPAGRKTRSFLMAPAENRARFARLPRRGRLGLRDCRERNLDERNFGGRDSLRLNRRAQLRQLALDRFVDFALGKLRRNAHCILDRVRIR